MKTIKLNLYDKYFNMIYNNIKTYELRHKDYDLDINDYIIFKNKNNLYSLKCQVVSIEFVNKKYFIEIFRTLPFEFIQDIFYDKFIYDYIFKNDLDYFYIIHFKLIEYIFIG